MAKSYDHKNIEQKWQEIWEKEGIYKTPDNVSGKENFYTLVEFAYPSGNLHVGHWYAFSVPDIYARYQRMNGKNVLYPIGFDSFGLPAENAAIKRGLDPKEWTYSNMDNMRAQLRSMGAMFDWDRAVATSDPEYYKWTQSMFTKFFEKDLVYRATTKVNWCPKDQTILANEQVVNGKCERCDTEVIQKDQDQWSFRITKYADRLHDDLETLDWPESIKDSQRAWIGRSEGAEIDFKIKDSEEKIKIFTTRPDTLFGVTYVVLSPEHSLLEILLLENKDEVSAYAKQAKNKSDLERQQTKEKTGVELKGVKAINPANGEEIPVWVSDYVLSGYGTGAVMAVPAHDERDFEFAKKFGLPLRQAIIRETGIKRENEEFRDGGAAVVFDPISQKYAVALHDDGKPLLFAGGVGENELVKDAVVREVLEESGLYDFKNVELLEVSYAHYFNTAKKVNRVARAEAYLITLDSTQTKEIHLEAHEKFVLGWKSAEDILSWWEQHNDEDGFKHYIRFLTEGVARLIERGIDTTSDPKKFRSTPITERGILENSDQFSGLSSEEAKSKITEFVGGKMKKTYRLRDWGISRQRYWGVPIPIVYDGEGKAHPVPDEHLPWLLPTDVDHTPDGTAPLARSKELLERTEKIFGTGWKPEVETMDTFVDSSWYFYRYLDAKNNTEFCSKEKMEQWMPINMYFGGAEHTTMHLLYSRFWNKALFDLGLVKDSEPYAGRRNRGLILGPDGNKMSKSKGNVIDPDELVHNVGADTVRMYLAFMGPYGVADSYPWDPNGFVGIRRFLERVLSLKDKISDTNNTNIDKTIKKVQEDIERLKFNTAISSMMILVNTLEDEDNVSEKDYKMFLQILAPFAPHLTEEIWHDLGEEKSIHLSSWPKYDEAKIKDEKVKVIIQVNGKLRDEVEIDAELGEEEVKNLVLSREKIQTHIGGGEIKKFIYVKGKIANIVI